MNSKLRIIIEICLKEGFQKYMPPPSLQHGEANKKYILHKTKQQTYVTLEDRKRFLTVCRISQFYIKTAELKRIMKTLSKPKNRCIYYMCSEILQRSIT